MSTGRGVTRRARAHGKGGVPSSNIVTSISCPTISGERNCFDVCHCYVNQVLDKGKSFTPGEDTTTHIQSIMGRTLLGLKLSSLSTPCGLAETGWSVRSFDSFMAVSLAANERFFWGGGVFISNKSSPRLWKKQVTQMRNWTQWGINERTTKVCAKTNASFLNGQTLIKYDLQFAHLQHNL